MTKNTNGEKMVIIMPVLAAILAGAVGWVMTIHARVSANEATIDNTQVRMENARVRIDNEVDLLRKRVAELEQKVSRIDERTTGQ